MILKDGNISHKELKVQFTVHGALRELIARLKQLHDGRNLKEVQLWIGFELFKLPNIKFRYSCPCKSDIDNPGLVLQHTLMIFQKN